MNQVINYWKTDGNKSISWDDRQKIDATLAISETLHLDWAFDNCIIFDRDKLITHKTPNFSSSFTENIIFKKLGKSKWYVELEIADKSKQNGRSVVWKTLYGKKIVAKIIRSFFEQLIDIREVTKWSNRESSITREIDRRRILASYDISSGSINCTGKDVQKRYDFTVKEYLRIRKMAEEKKINPKIIEKFDYYYYCSYDLISSRVLSRGYFYASSSHFGWRASIKNYIETAELLQLADPITGPKFYEKPHTEAFLSSPYNLKREVDKLKRKSSF
jgi:hypothetical protein